MSTEGRQCCCDFLNLCTVRCGWFPAFWVGLFPALPAGPVATCLCRLYYRAVPREGTEDEWQRCAGAKRSWTFGTPTFLVAQTAIVGVWILINIAGWWVFDQYPFILLNLAFSLQAAYAAPLILLAQTRQADRDKVATMADAQHREEIARTSDERQRSVSEQAALLTRMLEQNTQLTQMSKELVERIESLTVELHNHIVESRH